MFNFFKKLKSKKKEEMKEIKEVPQDTRDGIARGMYCPSCGYVQVDESSNALPLEGFAICPNCGDYLKIGWFLKTKEGYRLAENAAQIVKTRKKRSVGHYRVRKPGPNLSRKKGNPNHTK